VKSLENTILQYLDLFVDENISKNSIITYYEDYSLNWSSVFKYYYVMNSDEIHSVNFKLFRTDYLKVKTIKNQEKIENKISKNLFSDFSTDKNRIDLNWFKKIIIEEPPFSSHFLIRDEKYYYHAYFVFKDQYIKEYKNNYGHHKKGDKTLDSKKNKKAYKIFKDSDIFFSTPDFYLKDRRINSPCLFIPVSKQKLKDFKKIYNNKISEVS